MTHARPANPAPADAGLDRLLGLLTEQRDLYAQLRNLSERQSAHIDEGRTEHLLSILSDRQGLVQGLTAINADLAPLRGRMSELSAAAPAADRQRLRSLVDEVQHLLESIIESDDRDRRALEDARTRVGQELTRTAAAPRALRAYRSTGSAPSTAATRPATSRFTDRRG